MVEELNAALANVAFRIAAVRSERDGHAHYVFINEVCGEGEAGGRRSARHYTAVRTHALRGQRAYCIRRRSSSSPRHVSLPPFPPAHPPNHPSAQEAAGTEIGQGSGGAMANVFRLILHRLTSDE